MGITYPTRIFEYVKRVFDSRIPTVPLIKEPVTKAPPVYYDVAQPFERAKPEDTGIPSGVIQDFLRELSEDRTLNMHSVMIIKDRKVICEASFGPYDLNLPRYTFSACKSVVSLAIGMLIDEGTLSTGDKVVDMFPELNIIVSKRYDKLTVEDLLTMRSSSCFNEVGAFTEENWEKEFFTILSSGMIGKSFLYNSLNTYILSAIVKRKSGLGLVDYLRPRLFEPLGIQGVSWEKCPSGIERGGWGLYICPEDMAKLGQLVLDGGMWNGKRIISKDYLDKATTTHVVAPRSYGDYNYGYQMWIGRNINSFLFNGMFGQNMLCFRDTGTILVSNAGNNELFQQSSYYGYAQKYFSSVQTPLPSSKTGAKQLGEYIDYLKNPAAGKYNIFRAMKNRQMISDNCNKLAGKTYSLSEGKILPISILPLMLQMTYNSFTQGLHNVGFTMSDGKFCLVYGESDASFTIPIGFENYEKTDIKYGSNTFRIAVLGKFAVNEDDMTVLKLKIDFIETPFSKIIKLVFDGDRIRYSHDDMPGVTFIRGSIASLASDFFSRGILAGMGLDSKFDDPEYIMFKAAGKLAPRAEFVPDK